MSITPFDIEKLIKEAEEDEKKTTPDKKKKGCKEEDGVKKKKRMISQLSDDDDDDEDNDDDESQEGRESTASYKALLRQCKLASAVAIIAEYHGVNKKEILGQGR